MKEFYLQTQVDPFDNSRGLDTRVVYKPLEVLQSQYSFASITIEAPPMGSNTTRYVIKPAGSGPAIYAYSWEKQEDK